MAIKQGKKRYKAWCEGCDRCIVGGGKKCPLCGVRQVEKKPRKNYLTSVSPFPKDLEQWLVDKYKRDMLS